MNTKRVVRWVIVLFLLAALPVMTAVMAQGQEPAAQAPVATEQDMSMTPMPWQNNETEPNNGFANANVRLFAGSDGIAFGGKIQTGTDVDYYKLVFTYLPERDNNNAILIDVEAYRPLYSALNAVICLYSDDFVELACNDDTDTVDPLLYYNVDRSRNYYVSIRSSNNVGGSAHVYQILVSTPVMISAAAANLKTGYVANIPFQSGDILAWSFYWVGGYQWYNWTLLFDLSDLGVKGNLTNLAAGWQNSDFLLVGFAADAVLPGINRPVTPWEVVVFNPTTIGPKTEGTFSLWWDGRQQGLTTAAEKIDAIDWPKWTGAANLLVSTIGAASTPTQTFSGKLADEDVGLWKAGGVGGVWYRDFDGVGPGHENWGLGTKDIVAFSETKFDRNTEGRAQERYRIVLQGTATLNWTDPWTGQARTTVVTQEDILTLYHDIGYDYWWMVDGWVGSDYGWNYAIDALAYPTVSGFH